MLDPDGKTIALWKSEFGEVFSVGGYIFRALKIVEHRNLIIHKEWDPAEAEDYIVATTLLYPQFEDLEESAGLISSLAEEVINISCYGDVSFAKEALTKSRDRVNEVINLMKIFIIAAMPSYTDEALDVFSFSQLSFKVALAEKILEVRLGGTTLELVDPAEEAQKEKERIEKELSTKKAGQAISTDPVAQRLRSALG